MTTDTIVRIRIRAIAAPTVFPTLFAFALIWAALVAGTVSKLGPLSVTLLVLYPVFDVAAAVVDVRSAKNTKPFIGLYVNIAISLLAGVGLALAASSGIPGILRVWGIWASASGLIQLVVGLVRRTLQASGR